MRIGYIKINDIVSQLFVNKEDTDIIAVVTELKITFEKMGQNVDIGWDNIYTDKAMYELLEFLGF
jgi:hypothetical protein